MTPKVTQSNYRNGWEREKKNYIRIVELIGFYGVDTAEGIQLPVLHVLAHDARRDLTIL